MVDIHKDFAEASVAEFFKKNRQMLGYSGKIRSLTTVVHEYVTNSVTWDTPTVIKTREGVEIVPIGQAIDGKMGQGKTENYAGMDSLRDFDRFQVLCFDKGAQKLKFKEAKSLHRHRMAEGEKIYKIRIVGNRAVESTAHHGLFTLRNGKVEMVRADELDVGDYLVVPRKAWPEGNQTEVNLIEEALKLPDEELKEFGVYGVRGILFGRRDLMDKIKSQLSYKEKRYYFYSKYMLCDRLPMRLLRVLAPEERKLFYSCYVGARYSKRHLPAILPVTEELMEFLGLYAAEGNTRESLLSVSLSFGAHEKEIIDYAAGICKRLFGEASVKRAHDTAVNVTVCNATLGFILKRILKCGTRATEKRVPRLVFNVSHDLARHYFFAYLAGDGYPSKRLFDALVSREFYVPGKITLATSSDGLALDLVYLLSCLGVSYSLQETPAETRMVLGKAANFKKSHRIEFYLDQVNSPLNFYPIERGGISAVTDCKLKWAINSRDQQIVQMEKVAKLALKGALVTPEAVTFCNGDLGVLQVTDIETREPRENEHVYDYSIDGDENFIGGFGAVCLHNSLDACEEAGVPPDVFVQVDKLGQEHYKVTVEDNGPGIPKKLVGKAFGKMLAGTKFHRFQQARGQQGIGGAGCVMYGQVTTGKPTKVVTSSGNGTVYECHLTIDVKVNEAKIADEKEYSGQMRGTRIETELKDVMYQKSDQNPDEYLRRTALANPHVKITYINPDSLTTVYDRAIDAVPPMPKSTQPHPKGITVDDLLGMTGSTSARTVKSFLTTEFSRMSSAKAEEIQKIVGFDMNKRPKDLHWEEAEQIVNAIKGMSFIAPPTDILIPINEQHLEKALENILKPEFKSVLTRPPAIYHGGVPFIVEVALAYGGKAGITVAEGQQMDNRMEIMRFANRVPMLFDTGGCGITKAIQDVEWKRYGLQPDLPLTVLVNFTSIHVPYTGAGKQAVADDEDIIKEIRLALMDAGRKLGLYVSGKHKKSESEARLKALMRYVDPVAEALHGLTDTPLTKLKKELKELIEAKYSAGEIEEGNGEELEKEEELEENGSSE